MNSYNVVPHEQLVAIAESLELGEQLTSPKRGIEDRFFFVYTGVVVAKERARGANFYTPKATRDFEEAVRNQSYRYMLRQGWKQPFAFPMLAVIDIHTAMPDAWPEWKKTLARNDLLLPSKQDTDNKVKAIQDGMNKIVFRDDKQIVSVQARQVFRDNHMFSFHITPMGLTKLEVDRLEKIMKSRGN